jgi:hypothetical protein
MDELCVSQPGRIAPRAEAGLNPVYFLDFSDNEQDSGSKRRIRSAVSNNEADTATFLLEDHFGSRDRRGFGFRAVFKSTIAKLFSSFTRESAKVAAHRCFCAAARTRRHSPGVDIGAAHCDFHHFISLAMETGAPLGGDSVQRTILIRFLSTIGIGLSFVCYSSDAAFVAADLLSRIAPRFVFLFDFSGCLQNLFLDYHQISIQNLSDEGFLSHRLESENIPKMAFLGERHAIVLVVCEPNPRLCLRLTLMATLFWPTFDFDGDFILASV